jgi:hypothetical protein
VSLIASAIVSGHPESAYACNAAEQSDSKANEMRERHRHKLRGDAVDENGRAREGFDQQLDRKADADHPNASSRDAT